VRTLSPKSTALIAVSELPIEVPFHSVIGQQHQGPKERGSDGVVPYWSSHLSGAQSELVVRSGHGVIDNPDAMREVIRILHLEQRSTQNGTAKNKMPDENTSPISPIRLSVLFIVQTNRLMVVDMCFQAIGWINN